ncbi:MAG: DUF456 domain-containing protein [Flavobacteriales bacterium]|nr:DUF456 domain-containing protein [Bacteroidota bacterium]MCB9241270.1 DUF456 domain-containing protein [Flavobacteriales bacterium]
MDIVLIIVCIAILIVGLVGCIVPALPGPPVGYIALPLLYLHSSEAFHPDTQTLLIYGVVVILITVLDYYLPIWGTKKFGGTKAGKTGSIVGLILAFIFPIFGPFTILVGPFVGAIAGELMTGQDSNVALRSGIGSFLGFVAGTLLKLGVVVMITVQFVKLVWF